jgi:hypothetical protein
MAASPSSGATKLYRNARRAVILAGLALMLVPAAAAQSAPAKKAIKGPRALGLIELAANGKAHLVPITILYDGEYYDASAYKAAPVPMALESGTVYEGFRAGVSLGLFTVTSALQGNNTWLGAGTWRTDTAIAAAKDAAAKKRAAMSKPAPEPPEGPPVLRRASPKAKGGDDAPAGSTTSGSSSSPPTTSGPATPPSAPPDEREDSNRPVLKRPSPASGASTDAPAASDDDSDRPVLKRPAAAPAPAPATTETATTPASPDAPPPDDPNRPVLKRGAPTPAELKKRNAAIEAAASSSANKKDTHQPSTSLATASGQAASAAPVQLIAAISDASGPEPRPYAYSLKPEEEVKLRKKILAMAADEVRAWATQPESAGAATTTHAARPGVKARPPEPTFEDVQLHPFDLSNSNEPVIVLTAKARMPARLNTTSDLQYIITLVARDDMYGDLHKVFASVTDTHHFDVLSRLELIDAVDADGDGRGELLFRQVSDSGSAFVLYRVIGDRLWPLFQGTPQ